MTPTTHGRIVLADIGTCSATKRVAQCRLPGPTYRNPTTSRESGIARVTGFASFLSMGIAIFSSMFSFRAVRSGGTRPSRFIWSKTNAGDVSPRSDYRFEVSEAAPTAMHCRTLTLAKNNYTQPRFSGNPLQAVALNEVYLAAFLFHSNRPVTIDVHVLDVEHAVLQRLARAGWRNANQEATGGVCLGAVGESTSPRSVGATGPTKSNDCGVDANDRTGSERTDLALVIRLTTRSETVYLPLRG